MHASLLAHSSTFKSIDCNWHSLPGGCSWNEKCIFRHGALLDSRRDPLQFFYEPVKCMTLSGGKCPKGRTCEMAHSKAECDHHPLAMLQFLQAQGTLPSPTLSYPSPTPITSSRQVYSTVPLKFTIISVIDLHFITLHLQRTQEAPSSHQLPRAWACGTSASKAIVCFSSTVPIAARLYWG